MNITILGTGAYGIALASILNNNGHNVIMWTKVSEEYDMLNNNRCNKKVLSEYYLHKKIKYTMNMEEAIKFASLIIIAIPVKYLSDTVMEMKKYYKKKQHICIASKGILDDKKIFSSRVVSKYLHTNKVGVISGGSFAKDIIGNNPIGLTIASKNEKTSMIIYRAIESEIIKTNITSDMISVQLWGAIKNVIAIGCGITEGMHLSESTKCMFFAKCFNEMIDVVYELGGNKKSALMYAGIGDLYLTCTSLTSRNYTFGKMIGNMEDVDDYKKKTTIEGMDTLNALYNLLKKKKIKSDIIATLYVIIYKKNSLDKMMDYLKK